MGTTIAQIAEVMQTILGEVADETARETGFIQRQVKLSGSSFLQTLVFGFQSNPDLSYSEMSQSAASVGLAMSAQGVEQRFTPQAAEFVQRVLEKTVAAAVALQGDPSRTPLLERFNGIYVRDSCVVPLPKALQAVWHGNGGNQGATAALKLQVELNYASGQLAGPVLSDGRSQDQTSPYQARRLPARALHLADLGYFDLDRFQADHRAQVFWLSRWKPGTSLYFGADRCEGLLAWLRNLSTTEMDVPIGLGARHRIPCRLLVQRVPQEVADQRRRRLREAARIRGQTVSAERLALAEWTLLVTNVPVEQLSLPEAWVLLRIRWQVELLFKLWKSHMQIDAWRSANPWRILCEIYAKLIGVVIDQWIFLVSLWPFPNRSLFRAAKTLQKFALALAMALSDKTHLLWVLSALQACLRAGCRQETRKAHPAAFQLLLAFQTPPEPLR